MRYYTAITRVMRVGRLQTVQLVRRDKRSRPANGNQTTASLPCAIWWLFFFRMQHNIRELRDVYC